MLVKKKKKNKKKKVIKKEKNVAVDARILIRPLYIVYIIYTL